MPERRKPQLGGQAAESWLDKNEKKLPHPDAGGLLAGTRITTGLVDLDGELSPEDVPPKKGVFGAPEHDHSYYEQKEIEERAEYEEILKRLAAFDGERLTDAYMQKLERGKENLEISLGIDRASDEEQRRLAEEAESRDTAAVEYFRRVLETAQLTKTQRAVMSQTSQGKSQAQIATKLGISQQAVSKALNRSIEKLSGAAKALGCDRGTVRAVLHAFSS